MSSVGSWKGQKVGEWGVKKKWPFIIFTAFRRSCVLIRSVQKLDPNDN
jgi:hypothetical protein